MSYPLVCYTDERFIRVRFSPDLYEQIKALTAARTSSNEGHPEITFPKQSSFAYLLHHEVGQQIENRWYSDEFTDLVMRGKNQAFARTLIGHSQVIGPDIEADPPSWEHQRRGYDLVRSLDCHGLWLRPGGGKTKIIINAIANDPELNLVLVVGPNRVIELGEWTRQFERHWPEEVGEYQLELLTKEHAGSVTQRAERLYDALQRHEPGNKHIVLVNYEAVWRDPLATLILDAPWDAVVLDESHRIKAAGSKVSLFMARLGDRVQRKYLLTGTPMPNTPLDVYGQFRFLDKTVFGTSFEAFKHEHAVFRQITATASVFVRMRDPEAFDAILDRYVYRPQIEHDIPQEQDIPLTFQLPPKARKHYAEMEQDFFTYIESEAVEASNVLVRLLRLQQLVGGYAPKMGEVKNRDGETEWRRIGWIEVHDAKWKFLTELLIDLPHDRPIIVFCLFHEDMNNVRRATEHKNVGLRYGELSGRHNDYERYIAGDIDVMAVQISAGAEGINEFVNARYGIFYSTGYSLGKYEQARARLVRPGQQQSVTFYHLHGANTIDEQIYQSLQTKQAVIGQFMGQMGTNVDTEGILEHV